MLYYLYNLISKSVCTSSRAEGAGSQNGARRRNRQDSNMCRAELVEVWSMS